MSTLDRIQHSTLDSQPRRIYCYRYYAFCEPDYDEEDIWRDLQLWGGSLSIRSDCIDFYVPADYITFFIIKYPELSRQTQLDYI